MSFILGQMLVCLLLAGLLGAIFGWLLRGGCSSKLRDCEDEWKMKLGSMESEYSTRLQKNSSNKELASREDQTATLKRHAEHVKSHTPTYSYEQKLQEELNLAQNVETVKTEPTSIVTGTTALTGAAALGTSTLLARNISLDDDKVSLYAEHGIDFEKAEDLEDNYDIQAIDGIDFKHSEKLKTAGITSTKELAQLAQESESKQKLAKELGIEPTVIESWIGKSCLLELPGVNTKTADMLHNAGITSNKIATSTPAELHQELETFSKNALIPVSLPDPKSISLWSKMAKPVAVTSALGATATIASSSLTEGIEALKMKEPVKEVINNTQDYAQELQEKLKITPAFDAGAIKDILASRNIDLSSHKIELYADNGIDFENMLHLEDNYDIQALEGVDASHAESLRDMGIASTQELVTKLASHQDKIDQVAKTLEVQPESISSWISMADLIQLPGVDASAAKLMQTVGITTTRELGITNANSLYNEMVSFNEKSPIVTEIPSTQSLGLWSKIAKLLG